MKKPRKPKKIYFVSDEVGGWVARNKLSEMVPITQDQEEVYEATCIKLVARGDGFDKVIPIKRKKK